MSGPLVEGRPVRVVVLVLSLVLALTTTGCARNMLGRDVVFDTGSYTFRGEKLTYVSAKPVGSDVPAKLPLVIFVEEDGRTCEAYDEGAWQRFLTRWTGDYVLARPAGLRNAKCGTPAAAQLDFLSRVDEIGAVIDSASKAHPGPVVLLGVSNGAQLLPLVAEKKASVAALVNLGGGVDELSVVVPEAERHKGLPKAQLFANQAEIEKQIERLRGRPTSTDPMWERTERFWHQLFFSGTRERWFAARVPTLVLHGELDETESPVELMRPARRELKRAGNKNVDIVFVDGAGHDLLLPPVMLEANAWITEKLSSK